VGWIALLFIVVPVIELGLLIRLGGFIGLLPTLALIVFTGVVGARLAQQQGLSVLQRFQAETQAGRIPGDAMFDGAIILFSGALLLTPGILTDVVGFMGLIPMARAALKRALRASMAKAVSNGQVRMHTFVVGDMPSVHQNGPHLRTQPGASPDAHPFHHPAQGRPPVYRGGPIIDITPDEPKQS